MWTKAWRRSCYGATLMLAGALGGCTLIGNFEIQQCNIDKDCSDRGGDFANTYCNADHFCVPRGTSTSSGTGGGGSCTNAGCTAQLQEPSVCLKPENTCAKLLGDGCTDMYPTDGYKDDNALFIGFMGATTGALSFGGQNHFGSVKLALHEITNAIGSIPGPSSSGRPLVALYCDEVAGDFAQAATTAKHLSSVHVQAVIGPTGSKGVISMVNNGGSVANHIYNMSGSAGAVSLLNIATGDLSWSAWPNDKFLIPSAQINVSALEADLNGQGINPIKVAFVIGNDTVSTDFEQAAHAALTFNGGQSVTANEAANNYKLFEFGLTDTEAELAQIASDVIAFRPNIIMQYGGALWYQKGTPTVENNWPSGVPKPYWVFFERDPFIRSICKESDLGTAPFNAPGDLMARVRGGDIIRTSMYQDFVTRWEAFNADLGQVGTYAEGTYDATYVTAYSLATLHDVPTENLTGEQIAKGISQLVPDPTATPGTVGPGGNISMIIGALIQGYKVDLTGVANPLDFDMTQTTGVRSPPADLSIFCVHKDATATPPDDYVFQDSGLVYHYATKTTTGTYTPCN